MYNYINANTQDFKDFETNIWDRQKGTNHHLFFSIAFLLTKKF